MRFIQKTILFGIPCLAVILLCGCGAANSAFQYTPWGKVEGAGFFTGLLDGFVSFWCLLISIFTTKIEIYNPKNIGFCYNFGFAIGLLFFVGSFEVDGGGGGGDNKKPDDPTPDPGDAKQPRRAKKVRGGIRIRGTDIRIPPIQRN